MSGRLNGHPQKFCGPDPSNGGGVPVARPTHGHLVGRGFDVNLTPGSVPLTRISELTCVNLKRFTPRKKSAQNSGTVKGKLLRWLFAAGIDLALPLSATAGLWALGAGLDGGVP
jgi:hypothetical protein